MTYSNCYGTEKNTLKWHFECASNVLLCATPKLVWKMKKHPFFMKKNYDAICLKITPFQHFLGHRCIASNVASNPPSLPQGWLWGILSPHQGYNHHCPISWWWNETNTIQSPLHLICFFSVDQVKTIFKYLWVLWIFEFHFADVFCWPFNQEFAQFLSVCSNLLFTWIKNV